MLEGGRGGAALTAISDSIRNIAELWNFVQGHTGPLTVIAIDASLIIENVSGQRPCETAVGKVYGGREVSCHTCNLRRYPDPASVQFARRLLVFMPQRPNRFLPRSF